MFPRSPVRASGALRVGGGHEIYWEESGNPDGIPAIYLHGGPGGTLGVGGYRSKFDPDKFRIIAIDQRGCGRSRPRVTAVGYDLAENTTAHLVADIEAVREHLGVDRWLVNGVSWGVTLALAYAQAHPARVTGIVAMAITTTDRSYVDWITERVGAIFPEAWDRLATHAENAGIGYHRGQARIIDAYAQLLADSDPGVRDAAAVAWRDWEDEHVSLGPDGLQRNPRFEDPDFREVYAILVTHYWANDAFLDPPVLQRLSLINHIPATFIHGRLDVSGPTLAAWELHQAMPASELHVEEREGHGGPAMVDAWCAANSRHAERIAAESGRVL